MMTASLSARQPLRPVAILAAASFLFLGATVAPAPTVALAAALEQPASVLDRISSSPLPDPQQERILVPGQPPLTEAMVRRYTDVIGWVFDVHFTHAQRDKMRGFVTGYWKSANQDEIQGVLSFLELEAQMAGKSAAEREFVRLKILPDVLQQARKEEKQDAEVAWVLSLYRQAHPPLAAGDPPLTRAVCNAFAEVAAFMVTEAGGNALPVTSEFKDSVAATLARDWNKRPASARAQIVQMPLLWATLRAGWPQMPEADKVQLRQQWRTQLAALVPRTREQVAAEKAVPRLQALIQKAKSAGPLSPGEMKAAAGYADTVVVALKQQGGEQATAMAAQYAEMAKRLRTMAAAASTPRQVARSPRPASALSTSRRLSSNEAYARAMQQLQSRHNAYVLLSNMNTIRHVGNMNVIATIGNSPYRWSTR